jgi:hypothetical protein
VCRVTVVSVAPVQTGAAGKHYLRAMSNSVWRTICQRLVVLAILRVPGVARRRPGADGADDLRGCWDPGLAIDVLPAVCGEIIAVACANRARSGLLVCGESHSHMPIDKNIAEAVHW